MGISESFIAWLSARCVESSLPDPVTDLANLQCWHGTTKYKIFYDRFLFFSRPLVHEKSYERAAATCRFLGSAACPSGLLSAAHVPDVAPFFNHTVWAGDLQRVDAKYDGSKFERKKNLGNVCRKYIFVEKYRPVRIYPDKL